MKALLAAYVAASLCSSLFAQGKIVTWNLQWFPGRAPASTKAEEAIHISLVHEELVLLNPDILLFQEIKGEEDAKLAIEANAGLELRVISNFPKVAGTGQQVAIASTEPPVASGWELFASFGDNAPPRGFAWAIYKSGAETILIYCVHLKSNRGGIEANIPVREESARRLLQHRKNVLIAHSLDEDTSTIIGGDFNTNPTDSSFESEATSQIFGQAKFQWCFKDVPDARRVTWPSDGRYPDNCFDYFFLRTSSRLETRFQVEVGTERASDHRAVSLFLTQP